MTKYRLEADLVRDFIRAMSSQHLPSRPSDIGQEFYYGSGRADVVLASTSGEVWAIEAKLTRWRDALNQAYRNTCFAHRSFVLLPWAVAERAAVYSAEFEMRGVGICALRDGQVVVVQDAARSEPIQPWLTGQALAHIQSDPATSGHAHQA